MNFESIFGLNRLYMINQRTAVTMIQMRKKIAGIAFVLLSIAIMSVSAYVYESATQQTTQTIVNVASLTLNNADLGTIEEGQTITYPTTTPALNSILSTTTSKASVILNFVSDLNLQTNYATYNIDVVVNTVPGGSVLSGTVATLSIGSPSTSITLDVAGDYIFDFQITTTANSVTSDQLETVNITVTAEST